MSELNATITKAEQEVDGLRNELLAETTVQKKLGAVIKEMNKVSQSIQGEVNHHEKRLVDHDSKIEELRDQRRELFHTCQMNANDISIPVLNAANIKSTKGKSKSKSKNKSKKKNKNKSKEGK